MMATWWGHEKRDQLLSMCLLLGIGKAKAAESLLAIETRRVWSHEYINRGLQIKTLHYLY